MPSNLVKPLVMTSTLRKFYKVQFWVTTSKPAALKYELSALSRHFRKQIDDISTIVNIRPDCNAGIGSVIIGIIMCVGRRKEDLAQPLDFKF